MLLLPFSPLGCQQAERDEELESLQAIFPPEEVSVLLNSPDGVKLRFKIVSAEAKDSRCCLLDVQWGASYPSEPLTVSIGNKDTLSARAVSSITAAAAAEAEACVGMAATFAVVQVIRDGFETFVPLSDSLSLWEQAQQSAAAGAVAASSLSITSGKTPSAASSAPAPAVKEAKAEVKSKSAKRREGNVLGEKGELARGHNWVDVIAHLRKGGTAAGEA
jgi:hypothetical protein